MATQHTFQNIPGVKPSMAFTSWENLCIPAGGESCHGPGDPRRTWVQGDLQPRGHNALHAPSQPCQESHPCFCPCIPWHLLTSIRLNTRVGACRMFFITEAVSYRKTRRQLSFPVAPPPGLSSQHRTPPAASPRRLPPGTAQGRGGRLQTPRGCGASLRQSTAPGVVGETSRCVAGTGAERCLVVLT